MNAPVNPNDWLYLVPFIIMVTGALLVALADAFVDRLRSGHLAGLTAFFGIATAISGIALARHVGDDSVFLMKNMLVADQLGYIVITLAGLLLAAVSMLANIEQISLGWIKGETYTLLLFATCGLGTIAMSADLVTVFLGIETMSLPVYALVASRRRSSRSLEAAMKYFIAGAFASALLVFGMALIYGATGATAFHSINMAFEASSMDATMTTVGILGMFLLVAAFGFKVAAVPFHMWTPDAYEGAPASITAYMATAVKAGAVIGMVRVFGWALGGSVMPWGFMGWADPLAILAAVTMTVANVAALRQRNMKRMLAYSSISHAGMLLVGVVAIGLGSVKAEASLLYYLVAYGSMTIGLFAVMVWLSSDGSEKSLISDWAGLAKKKPAAALAATILLLSLAGLPPTSGFFAKFSILLSSAEVFDQQLMWLVIVAALNSAISIFYYLGVVMTMYFKDSEQEFNISPKPAVTLILVVSVLLVFEMGILPGHWLSWLG